MAAVSADRFQARFEQLPQTLPIFPLPGVLLLPYARLPLNIFEPRYMTMVEDALAAGRLIGMVQPSDPLRQPPMPEVEGKDMPRDLYRVGCAGRIAAFSETSDGRLLVTLIGVCRFDIAEEIRTLRGYRRIKPDWQRYSADLAAHEIEGPPGFDRKKLIALLKGYFAQAGIGADWDMITQSEDAELVDSLAMICPFGANEKQALLEAPDIGSRAKLIMALIEMSGMAQSADGRPHH